MSQQRLPEDPDTGHDYDGIREFDNPLPRWWLATFYGSVVFAIGYWLYFHTLEAGLLPRAVYEAELQQLEDAESARLARLEAEGKGVNEEQLWSLARDPQVVQRGKGLFIQNCLSCHGDRGQGIIGPNLTDSYWLHGDKALDIYRTIGSGVLDKGMPAWRPLLGVNKVRDATAFVLTLHGKSVPGKAPQGVASDGKVAP